MELSPRWRKSISPGFAGALPPGTPKVQISWRSAPGVNLSGKRTERPGASGEPQPVNIRLGTEGASRQPGETLRSVTEDDNIPAVHRGYWLDVLFSCQKGSLCDVRIAFLRRPGYLRRRWRRLIIVVVCIVWDNM